MSKAFLRWAGSKKRLIPELLKHWSFSNCDGYIEPFAGSAQLFFSIDCKSQVIGDVNQELINTYQQIKDFPADVYEELSLILPGKESYYRLRSIKPELLSPSKRAARLIFLNRYCFNGLYRTNLKGEFNVPYAGEKTGNLPTFQDLINISIKLTSTKIVNEDFDYVVRSHVKPNDFIYMDPPYAVSNSRIFSQYNPQTFGLKDLERLENLLKYLDSNGNSFLVSYANCDEAFELFSSWNIKKVNTQRYMRGFGKERKLEQELFIYNKFKIG